MSGESRIVGEFSEYLKEVEQRVRREVEAELAEKYERRLKELEAAAEGHTRADSNVRADGNGAEVTEVQERGIEGGSSDKRRPSDEKDRHLKRIRGIKEWPEVVMRLHKRPPSNATMLMWEELECLLIYLHTGVNITEQIKDNVCRVEAVRMAQLVCFTEITSLEAKIQLVQEGPRCQRGASGTYTKTITETDLLTQDRDLFKDDYLANYTADLLSVQELLKQEQVQYNDWTVFLDACIPEKISDGVLRNSNNNLLPWDCAVLEIFKRWGSSRMEAE
ncbi:uncharacterized protein CGFF_03189 [Nakaseomyces glabratus]|nr:uncharacterized protein CGFF_03189 [Nakaseomyces glabratus]SLM15002.1 uncharacterized protein CGFF_03189 [Nakaseomyces glabratus]